MTFSHWTKQDIQQMKALGIDPSEASRQLNLFKNPPPFMILNRPATIGDGILKLDGNQVSKSLQAYERARRQGRFQKFVPASGAASRMFNSLIKFSPGPKFSWNELREKSDAGDPESRQLLSLMESLNRMAFGPDLRKAMAGRKLDLKACWDDGRFKEILESLLSVRGLNYSGKPKGLVKFHAYPEGDRTAAEEHLVEAVHYVQDGKRTCHVHFTVSPEHLEEFRSYLKSAGKRYGKLYGVRFKIGFSVQRDSTNTLAVDKNNQPFRAGNNRGGRRKILFRPGGHGALIRNLMDIHGDLVFIKNIDNVVSTSHLRPTLLWKKILGGKLVLLQEGIRKRLKSLKTRQAPDSVLSEISSFAQKELSLDLGEDFGRLPARLRAEFLRQALDRPIRVCGVVPNAGEPGGGPFWVQGKDGRVSLQIVESAQVDPKSEEQQKLLKGSSHFNPVDLVCAVRNGEGKPYDLKKYSDPEAVFISHKSMDGRELKALELPGLWNGAMAYWITLFVEVPLETFNPVKTVFDLLKPAHQS